jgi:hypothetical protein
MNKPNKFDRLLDNYGRIIRWPKKQAEQMQVLKYLRTKFQSGKQYTESEINIILNEWHTFGDYALLRRMMYDTYLLERTPDCRVYWFK